jgi:hypothetical protein
MKQAKINKQVDAKHTHTHTHTHTHAHTPFHPDPCHHLTLSTSVIPSSQWV